MPHIPPQPTHAPRFAVGDEVMIRSQIDPARNTDRTSIIDRQWFAGVAEGEFYEGWQYVVACHLDAWAVEHSLRPRPQPANASWHELMTCATERAMAI